MPAYDTSQSEQSARLLHLHSNARGADSRTGRESSRVAAVAPRSIDGDVVDEASVIDLLIDRLADQLANAVVARLSRVQGHAEPDEWLDSRQAAGYLGLHRDTLRRLAAARLIPAEQDGRGCKLFFRREALDEWRQSGGRARHLASVADAA